MTFGSKYRSGIFLYNSGYLLAASHMFRKYWSYSACYFFQTSDIR